jgi:glycerate dehydrogenase
MKIVVLDGFVENPGDLSWKGFEELGDLTVYDRTPYEDSDRLILDRARGAQAVITNKTPLDRHTLTVLSPDLKYVGVLATGYNVVDVKAASDLGITVTNIPSYGTAAVAQYTMALLLEMCHQVGLHSHSVKKGDWTGSIDFSYWKTPQIELSGKTMGLIGYGRIGSATARLAAAFGMNVIAYTPHPSQNVAISSGSDPAAGAAQDDIVRFVPLDTLFHESDVISLHCPLTQATKGLIDASSIARMKDGVMLINTARGPLIVEEDLSKALDSGKVSFAAVDVLDKEPPRKDDPLIGNPRCLVTPHIAWASKESRQRLMDTAVDNLKAFMGGAPQNVVK